MNTLVRVTRLFLCFTALIALLLSMQAMQACGAEKDEVNTPAQWQKILDSVPAGDSAQADENANVRLKTKGEHPGARKERIAHTYAYGVKGSFTDPRLIRRLRAENLTPVESLHARDGAAAIVLRDDRNGGYIIAFRGTDDEKDRESDKKEWEAGKTIGTTQYMNHRELYDGWVEKYGRNGKLEVAGHSLGAGKAQICLSFHPEKIARTTLVQSPGVDLETAKRYEDNTTLVHRMRTEERGPVNLVQATRDPVGDVNRGHIGDPYVIAGTGTDMTGAYDMATTIGGHTQFVLQNPGGLEDLETGKPYISENADRVIRPLTIKEYQKYRGSTKSGSEFDKFVREGGASPRDPRWRNAAALQFTAEKRAARPSAKPGKSPPPITTTPVPSPAATQALPALLRGKINGPLKAVAGTECIYEFALEGPQGAGAAGSERRQAMEWFIDGRKQVIDNRRISVTWATAGARQLRAILLQKEKKLAEHSITVTVDAKPLIARLKGPRGAKVGERSRYEVSVEGGVGDYRFAWALNGRPLRPTEKVVDITWSKLGQAILEVTVTDDAKNLQMDRLSIEVKSMEPASSSTGAPASTSTGAAPGDSRNTGTKGGWVLVDTKLYGGEGRKIARNNAEINYETYSWQGAWSTPPAEMIPGETLIFKMAVSFTERSTAHGAYIGATVNIDQEKEGVAPGSGTASMIRIGSVGTDYSKGVRQASGSCRYTVPEGNRGSRFQIRCMLSDGYHVPGACFIYEYR
ncbi:MAG: hypothetical protein RDV48_15705 [Candidatus Eremiobacteraeota bacterium]|nr:hypothetical protein [Candidatus Eremiobacteraeota bacterium]